MNPDTGGWIVSDVTEHFVARTAQKTPSAFPACWGFVAAFVIVIYAEMLCPARCPLADQTYASLVLVHLPVGARTELISTEDVVFPGFLSIAGLTGSLVGMTPRSGTCDLSRSGSIRTIDAPGRHLRAWLTNLSQRASARAFISTVTPAGVSVCNACLRSSALPSRMSFTT